MLRCGGGGGGGGGGGDWGWAILSVEIYLDEYNLNITHQDGKCSKNVVSNPELTSTPLD